MSSPEPRPRWASLSLAIDPATSPELFQAGLVQWLELGLLDDAELKRQSELWLSCNLRDAPARSASLSGAALTQTSPASASVSKPLPEFVPPEPVVTSQPEMPATEGSPSRPPSALEAMGASLAAEFSLNWLLALGVFVVLVSSGALAASQWQRVTAIGQYSILWSYSLAFWGAGLWMARSEKLLLTGRMLRAAALLLVPVNFWAMDGLALWSSGLGLGLMAIASVSLVSLEVSWLRPRLPVPVWGGALAMAVLHWGWGMSGWPLISTYGGAAIAWFGFWKIGLLDDLDGTEAFTSPSHAEGDRQTVSPSAEPPLLGRALLAVGVLLLLVRAGLSPQVEFAQLGLLLGLCGWQVGWMGRSQQNPLGWLWVSGVVLLTAWRLTIVDIPLQALCISGLAMWLLGDRLRRLWRVADLVVLFGVGTQTLATMWLTLPAIVREAVVDGAIQLFSRQGMPEVLVSLGFFPSIWIAVWGTGWLRHQQQSRLAAWLEKVTVAWGVILLIFACLNPVVRSLYLLLSAGTLIVFAQRRSPVTPVPIYLTHVVGLLAAFSSIDAVLPQLDAREWGAILLVFALVEWGWVAFSSWRIDARTSERTVLWRQSAWYVGFGLAIASYLVLLLLVAEGVTTAWSWIWFAVPVTAAGMSQSRSIEFRLPPEAVAIGGSILGQFLTFDAWESRLFGLAVGAIAVGGMSVRRPQLGYTSLTLGFVLVFAGAVFWQIPPNPPEYEWWMVAVAGSALVLWIGQAIAANRGVLGRNYARAAHGWAIALTVLNLLSLSAYTLFAYANLTTPAKLPVAAAVLTAGAIAVRARTQFGAMEAWGLGIAVELSGASAIAFFGGSLPQLAVFNLALALALQVCGDLWVQQTGNSYRPSFTVAPAIYALGGFLLSLEEFTATSGLFTLALALVFVHLGRRASSFKAMTYVGLGATTLAAYQAVVYQLLQASGGEVGDGVALLAALAIAIAWIYQLLPATANRYLHLTRTQLALGGTLHWLLGSISILAAMLMPTSDSGVWIVTGTAVAAAIFGIAKGRSGGG